MNQPPGPRFNGPTHVRQRVRLATAVGFLVITAVGVGGLASLARGRPNAEPGATIPAPAPSSEPSPNNLLNHSARLEHEVREAEQAVTRARAAISSARRLGTIDPALLLEFERRLGLLGDSPLDTVRRSLGSQPDHEDRTGPSHLRAMANSPREL